MSKIKDLSLLLHIGEQSHSLNLTHGLQAPVFIEGDNQVIFCVEGVDFANKDSHLIVEGWSSFEMHEHCFEGIAGLNINNVNRADVFESIGRKAFGFKIIIDICQLDAEIDFTDVISIKVTCNLAAEDVVNNIHKVGPALTTFEDNQSILIVGSAPSIEKYKASIIEFNGQIWALNDAVFWLESNFIKVDVLVATDNRFFKKNLDKLQSLNCKKLVSIDTALNVDLPQCGLDIYVCHTIGRLGYSHELGRVYHGCSVLFTAIQVASSLGCTDFCTVGVMLNIPHSYERIDGTKVLPEYVIDTQLQMLRLVCNELRDINCTIHALEPTSNVNFY